MKNIYKQIPCIIKLWEEYGSSESLTDKYIETESEAEFVTASASSTQVSSEGSDLEGKTPKKTYGNTIQDDNATTEYGKDESEAKCGEFQLGYCCLRAAKPMDVYHTIIGRDEATIHGAEHIHI